MRARALMPIVALAAGIAAGCSNRQRIHIETELAKALVSDQQELAIGNQLEADLAKEHIRYLNDPQVVGYVQGIGDKIFPLAKKDRPGIAWHVHVIDDPKTVNAFAAPGGQLYVFSSLL